MRAAGCRKIHGTLSQRLTTYAQGSYGTPSLASPLQEVKLVMTLANLVASVWHKTTYETAISVTERLRPH